MKGVIYGTLYRNGHELRGLQCPCGKSRFRRTGRDELLGQPADQFNGRRRLISAVQAAGYGASLKGAAQSVPSIAEQEDALADHETPVLKRRLIASLGFLIVLMYFSMGHMMWGWPLPSFFDGNHVAMGLIQMLLTIATASSRCSTARRTWIRS